MNKKTKGALLLFTILGLGVATYVVLRNNKKRYATYIIQAGKYNGPYAALITFDEGFLKAWARAAKQNDASFSYKGKNYSTQGGKAI